MKLKISSDTFAVMGFTWVACGIVGMWYNIDNSINLVSALACSMVMIGSFIPLICMFIEAGE